MLSALKILQQIIVLYGEFTFKWITKLVLRRSNFSLKNGSGNCISIFSQFLAIIFFFPPFQEKLQENFLKKITLKEYVNITCVPDFFTLSKACSHVDERSKWTFSTTLWNHYYAQIFSFYPIIIRQVVNPTFFFFFYFLTDEQGKNELFWLALRVVV